MNILLFLPGILLLFVLSSGLNATLRNSSVIVLIQVSHSLFHQVKLTKTGPARPSFRAREPSGIPHRRFRPLPRLPLRMDSELALHPRAHFPLATICQRLTALPHHLVGRLWIEVVGTAWWFVPGDKKVTRSASTCWHAFSDFAHSRMCVHGSSF